MWARHSNFIAKNILYFIMQYPSPQISPAEVHIELLITISGQVNHNTAMVMKSLARHYTPAQAAFFE